MQLTQDFKKIKQFQDSVHKIVHSLSKCNLDISPLNIKLGKTASSAQCQG